MQLFHIDGKTLKQAYPLVNSYLLHVTDAKVVKSEKLKNFIKNQLVPTENV